jgi:hypothetical protein
LREFGPPNAATPSSGFCARHEKQCDYFCETCQVSLCADCIFDQLRSQNSDHYGHNISRITEVMVSARATLKMELELLRSSLAKIDNAL